MEWSIDPLVGRGRRYLHHRRLVHLEGGVDQGRVVFPVEGADLQLVDPAGQCRGVQFEGPRVGSRRNLPGPAVDAVLHALDARVVVSAPRDLHDATELPSLHLGQQLHRGTLVGRQDGHILQDGDTGVKIGAI